MTLKEIEIEGEKVYLKGKGKVWRVVYPIKTDGKINWKNLLLGGSWMNIVKVGLIVGIILFIAWSYKQDMTNCTNWAIENFCRVNW